MEAYLKAQGMFLEAGAPDPVFTDTLELDLGTVQPSLAGPKRPQDRVLLKDVASSFKADLTKGLGVPANEAGLSVKVEGKNYELTHGDVVIAAITSCTNTSNPSVLVARRPRGPQGARQGIEAEAVGEDVARARLAGGDRISRQSRA